MQLGFVGLGKMGANMVHRIHRDSEHECVAFDFNADAVSEAEGHGAAGARLARGARVEARARRARSGSWCRPATPPQQTVDTLAGLLDAGDTIIDGGNSRWTDDKARARGARAEGASTTWTWA